MRPRHPPRRLLVLGREPIRVTLVWYALQSSRLRGRVLSAPDLNEACRRLPQPSRRWSDPSDLVIPHDEHLLQLQECGLPLADLPRLILAPTSYWLELPRQDELLLHAATGFESLVSLFNRLATLQLECGWQGEDRRGPC